MSDRFALVFALFLAGLFALDVFSNDWQAIIFLGQKLVSAISWLAFWR